jgi:hypothetical protein
MKNLRILVLVICALALLCGTGLAGTVDISVVATSLINDGYTKLLNGATNLRTTTASIGKGYRLGWRFIKVPIPPDAVITSAVLEVYCYQGARNAITIRYLGEASNNAPRFNATQNNLTNRPETYASVVDNPPSWRAKNWNATPDLSPIIQEIISQPAWQAGNALVLFAHDEKSTMSRTIYMIDNGARYGARLNITYSIPDPLPIVYNKCTFDINGDGIPDFTLYDTDSDGYFEWPAGRTDYLGTLVIDKPIEIMGAPGVVRSVTTLKGDGFILADGGVIISDLVSPVVSGNYSGLKGNDLVILERNQIILENGGKIFLGGNFAGTWAGDVIFETTRLGANVSGEGGAIIYGRQVQLISDGGSVYAENCRITGASDVKFQTNTGDIYLSNNVSVSASAIDAKCSIIFKTLISGNVSLSSNVFLAADAVNMCNVKGSVNDDGTTKLIGIKECW